MRSIGLQEKHFAVVAGRTTAQESIVESGEETLRPAQLRGILNYVPLFRDHCFVLSLDSAVVAHEGLRDLIKDLAVLQSLRIRLIVTFGIGEHLQRLARERSRAVSRSDGQGPVDDATLAIAAEASDAALRTLLDALSSHGLRWVVPNAVRAEPMGVRGGIDQERAGRVGRLDTALLHALLEQECVPVLPPLQRTRDGQPLRLNSDELAAALACELRASKLIYLTATAGLLVDERPRINLPLPELRELLDNEPTRLSGAQIAKVRYLVTALTSGVERAHVLDGRVSGGLLTEVFDKVGLGTMVHADAYQQIRQARPKDIGAIFAILKAGARSEALRQVTRKTVEERIRETFVYEADGAIIGSLRLVTLAEDAVELAGVLVHPAYQRKGIGQLLVRFGIEEARRRGLRRAFALTTQAADFFRAQGFEDTRAEELPPARQAELTGTGRGSRVLAINFPEA